MARAIKGYHHGAYLALALRHEVDVERLSPQAMRSYLRANLRLIEAQIEPPTFARRAEGGCIR